MELTLSDFMEEYVEIKGKIKGLKEDLEAVRTNILVIIKTDDIENYEDDDNMLQFTINKRNAFDKKKACDFLLEAGENLDDYTEETEFEMLKIKSKGGNNDN